MRPMCARISVWIGALFAAAALLSQTFTANLTGVVTDPAGGAIPEATVRLENTATHERREVKTGPEGRFTFSQLLPGGYELQAEAVGFKTFVQRGINLIASQSAAVNFEMQIGAVSQQVEVGALALQVDTQTANQSVTMSR